MGARRNPETFWQAISELTEVTNPESQNFATSLKIRLIGQIDNSVIESIKRNNIEKYVEIIPYIPHNQVVNEQKNADVLLLFINNTPNAKGILTGKIFEYLSSGRPILGIGPENGDSARILQETQAGVVVDFNDKEKMKLVISDLFKKYQDNQLVTKQNVLIEKYSRRNLTKEFVKILNAIT